MISGREVPSLYRGYRVHAPPLHHGILFLIRNQQLTTNIGIDPKLRVEELFCLESWILYLFLTDIWNIVDSRCNDGQENNKIVCYRYWVFVKLETKKNCWTECNEISMLCRFVKVDILYFKLQFFTNFVGLTFSISHTQFL